MKHRILLDTDMGTDVDDAMCLALALASPEIELVAVISVSGDTDHRARISKRILQMAGREDVPVFAGRGAPLTPGATFASTGREGDGILAPGDAPTIEDEPGCDAIARLLRAEDDLELVAIGPMTNLAATIGSDPGLAGRAKQVTIMGGHVRKIEYAGFSFPFGIDYNLCSDPEASVAALRAETPTRLVTGDVTLQTWLRDEDVARLETSDHPLVLAIARAIRIWTPIQNDIFGGLGANMEGDNAAFLHDPLALACVHDESFCTFETLAIEPTIEDGGFRSIERTPGAPATRTMRVATAVDAERFRAHFVERLLRLGARAPSRRR